jgi:predicted ATP-grasp superfamily ATP-dependent carboligase
MDFLMSKFTFPLLCQEYGLPVPSTVMVQSADEALAAAARFGYPLIAKRRVGSAGDSVNFLPDTASLLALLDTLSPENPMAFQEFVSGQVGGSIALFDRGRLLCWVAFYKLKTYPGRFGPSTTLRFVDLPEYGPLLARLGEITGFHGISGADFIHDPETGRLILLEQHGRPMPQVYMGPSVGVDFSQAIREMLLGWTDTSASPVGNRSSKVIALFPQDICRSIAEDDPKSLVQWLYSPQWWQDITWREPKLLKSHLGLIRYTLRTRLRPAPQSRAPLGGSKTTELLPAVQEEPSLP